jgi:SulP family sulfate permease
MLDLSSVPAMDATGLVSLESAVDRLRSLGIFVVLAGVQEQPMQVLTRSGMQRRSDEIAVCESMERALAAAVAKSRLGPGSDPAAPLAGIAGS